MSDPRPLYPKGLRLEMDPRDVWAVTRRPPNVSEALTSTFSDLYWKTYAIVHHAGRVVELEQKECGAVVESLKQQPRLVGIAQTCSSTMRFEYEAMLGAAYAAQSLLARAVIESLTGATLEDEKRLPSFSELDDAIDNKSVQPGMIAARDRVREALDSIASWKSPDFFERLSPRHRIVHREHLRCTPILVRRISGVRVKPDRKEPLGVAYASREPIKVISQYSPDIEMGFELLVRQDDQPVPSGEVFISPPREIAQKHLPVLSSRAIQVAQQHLLAAALLLDALTEGPDPFAIITRQEAARRATPTTETLVNDAAR
jgi:hypothetical protein